MSTKTRAPETFIERCDRIYETARQEQKKEDRKAAWVLLMLLGSVIFGIWAGFIVFAPYIITYIL